MTIENGKAADDMASEGPRGPRGRTRADRIRRLIRYTGVNLVSLALDYAVFLSLTHAYDIPVIASILGVLAEPLRLLYQQPGIAVFRIETTRRQGDLASYPRAQLTGQPAE